MKKILAILLILVLALGCIGCGNNGDGDVQEPDGEGTGAEAGVNDGAEDGADESTEGADGETINPEDYYISDAYSDMEAEYDFDLKVESSFGLENVVQKVSYSDIGSLAAEVENRLNATAGSVLGTRFTVFSDYEEDDEDEIDKLAYAIGMENDDTEGIYLEGGAYHTRAGENYQYVIYISQNMYDTGSANTKAIMEDIEAAMGVTFKEKQLQKAIETAYAKGEETLDYFSLVDSETASGSGYDETIKVSVDCFVTEENVVGYYVSCERERCYA